MREKDIRDYTENLIDACRKHPEISISDMLMLREYAIREIGAGMVLKKETKEPARVKSNTTADTAATATKAKPTTKRVKTETKKVNTETTAKAERQPEKSDYEILRSLADPWN